MFRFYLHEEKKCENIYFFFNFNSFKTSKQTPIQLHTTSTAYNKIYYKKNNIWSDFFNWSLRSTRPQFIGIAMMGSVWQTHKHTVHNPHSIAARFYCTVIGEQLIRNFGYYLSGVNCCMPQLENYHSIDLHINVSFKHAGPNQSLSMCEKFVFRKTFFHSIFKVQTLLIRFLLYFFNYPCWSPFMQ